MCMGGGGAGGSGTQVYNWNDTLKPRWSDMLDWGAALKDPNGAGAYQQYPYQRIAGMTGDQNTAFDEIRNVNLLTNNPIPTMNAAMGQTNDTLNGAYLDGPGSNPYSTENQYSGFGPAFNSVLHQGQHDIADAYNQGTAADTTRMFNLAGAFGGSAHQNAMLNNEVGLGKTLNQYTSGMVNDQYNRSAGLQEQDLNRGSQNFENERGRMMGAIGAGNDQQGLALQRAQSLAGVGDANRSLTQDQYNQAYNDWQDRNNQQYRMADWYSGLLGRAQGGMSPNMTSTQSGYQASPFSQLLGAGLLGYGAFGGR